MNRFTRGSRSGDDAEDEQRPPVVPTRNKPLSHEEQRLMFEGTVHWGRGLAILLAMAGVLVVFLIILTVLPRPGNGNPLDSLTNTFGTSNTASLAGSTATAVAASSVRLSTVSPSTPVAAGATGTPAAGWQARAPSGANVRPAPSTNNQPVGALSPGQQVQVLGRSSDNAWYQIVWSNNQKAWSASELLQITSGDPTKIPVVSP